MCVRGWRLTPSAGVSRALGRLPSAQVAYVALLADPKKNERDLSARAFLVVLIYQELVALNWDDVPTNKVGIAIGALRAGAGRGPS